MKENELRNSLKIESPEDNGWLDSAVIRFLDEMSSRLYFWVDRNVIVKGGYNINDNNGLIINTLSHVVFKMRKAVPAAKELQKMGYLNLSGATRLGYEYFKSLLDKKRIQSFADQYGNDYWALNLNLETPSFNAVTDYLSKMDHTVEVILGNCSKGHQIQEAEGLTDVHVCEYRVKRTCFHNIKAGEFAPPEGSPFEICSETPCMIGHLHKEILNGTSDIMRNGCNFNTILGGYQTFREIPDFFNMNTPDGPSKFIIWGTCRFSIPYLVQAARMFPNIRGLAVAYANGCQTLSDRAIRLRGQRRDTHITRFKGPSTIEDNPVSRLFNGKRSE